MSTPPLFFLDELPGAEAAQPGGDWAGANGAGGDWPAEAGSATEADGPIVELTGDEGRHAARVKRLAPGERLLLADGRGHWASAVVTQLLGDGLRARCGVVWRARQPRPRLVAVQALPKGERAELAVEVMTELGVDEIVPWAAARSVVRWDAPRAAKALARWRRTATEAAKQSRRVRVPVIGELASTARLCERLAGASALVLHESAELSLATVPLPVPAAGLALAEAGPDGVAPGGAAPVEPVPVEAAPAELVIVIGPEGGIAAQELAAFAAAGAQAVRMGPGVLRTSTAGAAALAALSLRLGRWG